MSPRSTLPRLHLPFGSTLVATVLAASPGATAPEPSAAEAVVVSPPSCTAEVFPLAPFLDSLRVELAGRGLRCCTVAPAGDETPTGTALRVKVEWIPCTADVRRVQVSAHDPGGARMVAREVSLADVAKTAQPRALALATAELIRWLHQAPSEPLAALVAPASASLSAPAALPPARSRALSLHIAAEMRTFPGHDTTTWGGRARFTGHWRMLHADFDLGANSARVGSELGEVLLRSASVGLGLGPRFATRSVLVDLGPRLELGWAWIRGEPGFADVRSNASSGVISSAGLRLAVEAGAQKRWRPCLTLEGGGMIQGVKGDVDRLPAAGMTGYYLLAALGLGVAL
jgi:hypothetical protein